MADVDQMYVEAEKLKDAGQNDEAIARLNEILAADPGHVLSHLALAILYGKVQRYEDAVRSAQRACELEPQDPHNLITLSVVCRRTFEGTQDRSYIQMAEEAMARAQMLQGR
jgi:cytochrome c-type biogenesis protein CcmH/NrfG